ncbi:MAG: class I SAM-dependent methyltransferase [Candidatus Hydrothermarchaeales archaeon]
MSYLADEEEEAGVLFPEILGIFLNNPIRRILTRPKRRLSKLGFRNGIVLEVGCGPGFFTFPLADTNVKTFSIDISHNFLKGIMAKAKKRGIKNLFLVRCDASDLPFKQAVFEKVLIYLVYHEIRDRDGFVKDLSRVIVEEGVVVLVEVEPARSWLDFGPEGADSAIAKTKFEGHFEEVTVEKEGRRGYVLRAAGRHIATGG